MDDGRESYADTARAVGLSLSAVKRRVDRLVATGVLRGFSTIVDPAALGWAVTALLEVHTVGTVPIERMRRDLSAVPEVVAGHTVAGHTVAGNADAVLRLVASDVAHLERAMTAVRSLSYIQHTTMLVLLSPLVMRSSADGEGSLL